MTPHVPLFGGPAGDWLAVLGIVSVVYWLYRALAALIRYAQATPGEAEAAAARPAGVPADRLASDLPVIVAAVAAMLDRHRIVHIEEVPHGQVWSSQGRWLHQTSHQTH